MKMAKLNPDSRPASFSSAWRGRSLHRSSPQKLSPFLGITVPFLGYSWLAKHTNMYCLGALYATFFFTNIHSFIRWPALEALGCSLEQAWAEKPLGPDIDSLFP